MMHIRRSGLCVGLVLLLVASTTGCSRSYLPSDDPEAYAVYSALLRHVWHPMQADASRYVIASQTAVWPTAPRPAESAIRALGGAWLGYLRLNSHVWPLKRQFALELPYEIKPSRELALAIGGAAGELSGSFEQRFPGAGGYIQLSAVGFNASKTKAIVQMTWICGWVCGGGDTFVLDKENGHWGSPRSAFGGQWRF
jgi:hypothetical protein